MNPAARFFRGLFLLIGIALVVLFLTTPAGRGAYFTLRGAVYNLIPHKEAARSTNYAEAAQCRANLREIERAKRRAAAARSLPTGVLTVKEVEAALGHPFPRCPSGGVYTLNPVLQLPTCSLGTGGNLDPKDDHFLAQF